MYLGYQKEKIKFYTETPLDKEIYKLDKIEETEAEYVFNGDEYVLKTAEWETQQLQKAKDAKYTEALKGAAEYIDGGNLSVEISENKHIEASVENLAKLQPLFLNLFISSIGIGTETDPAKMFDNLMKILTGEMEGAKAEWVTKEDKLIELSMKQILKVLRTIGAYQTDIWSVRFLNYKKRIEQAQTIEEINNIDIDYTIIKGAENAVNIQ